MLYSWCRKGMQINRGALNGRLNKKFEESMKKIAESLKEAFRIKLSELLQNSHKELKTLHVQLLFSPG